MLPATLRVPLRWRRPRALAGVLAVALAVAFTIALAAPLPLAAREPIPPADAALEAALLHATNAARGAQGLAPVRQDEGLARAAREHAAEMAQLDYFSHGSPLPVHDSLQKRLALAGSPLVDVAENIVMLAQPGGDAAAASQAVDDWLHSPPHRRNLLDAHYDRVGFGASRNAQGELFVVQDFGAEPIQLVDSSVVRTSRTVVEVSVEVHARVATRALFHLGNEAPQTRDVTAGTSSVTLTTDAGGTVSLVVGVPLAGDHYVVDDGGTLDTMSGRYLPDPGEPRTTLALLGATTHRTVERGVQLRLRYAAPTTGHLALFVQGDYQPTARVGAGSFELFVPDAQGPTTVSVGLERSGNEVSILHRFHLDPGAAVPTLLAGKAP